MAFAWLRRSLGRRIVLAIGVTLGLICVGVAVNAIGIRVLGDVSAWDRWFRDHRPYLFVWRLLLYALIACGWWRMRQRVYRRDPSEDARARLRRAELAAVCITVLLESSLMVQRA